MPFLKFILLLLIPSNLSGGCPSKISVTGAGGQNVCVGQEFTITCQSNCHGYHVKLMKGEELVRSAEFLNNSVSVLIPSANVSHSGTYICQTEPAGSMAIAHVTVKDCGSSSKYLPTVSTTSSSLTNTTYQSPTPSRILEPVLICYILFKAAFFFIGSIIAALTTVFQR